jgi:hypothetical protein
MQPTAAATTSHWVLQTSVDVYLSLLRVVDFCCIRLHYVEFAALRWICCITLDRCIRLNRMSDPHIWRAWRSLDRSQTRPRLELNLSAMSVLPRDRRVLVLLLRVLVVSCDFTIVLQAFRIDACPVSAHHEYLV